MRKKRLLWQLYLPFLLITIFALVALVWYASETLNSNHRSQLSGGLEARALLAGEHIRSMLLEGREREVQDLVWRLGSLSTTRITVIMPDGKVSGDSMEDPDVMDNHRNRPEIVRAMSGGTGMSTRYSRTMNQNMMYVAVPVHGLGRIIGIVRTSLPLTSIEKNVRAVQLRIVLGGVIIALLAAAVSLFLTRRITRQVREMKDGAERFARGEYDVKLPVADSEELGGLAEALNAMAVQHDERIRTILEQHQEQETVLSGMVEGVIALDTGGHILNMNSAAARLLGTDPSNADGKNLKDIVRNTAMLEFAGRALRSTDPLEGYITLEDESEDRFIQATGSVLKAAGGESIGAVIVLNDITRLHKLENVRRDFVANVSHELKTPITSIKGFVETLQDGALKRKKDAKRFLDIIADQADRLNLIIEDLLSLSRIEQEEERNEIILERMNLLNVLQHAILQCEAKAKKKKVNILLNCDDSLTALINPRLFEQAVVNLLNNAINYSDPESDVLVTGNQIEPGVAIRISDSGVGIEQTHLPRLFERFYRVDKARSRKMGGTGLGLAIVKHIVQAHGGNIGVESAPGKGSTFTIILEDRNAGNNANGSG